MIHLLKVSIDYLKGKSKLASFSTFAVHHTAHLFHHFAGLFKLFDQLVHLADVHSCSGSDTLFPEGFRRSGFALSFGVMERIIASI